MACSICGKPSGPGAMLCRPCKAALKRARHYTVQDLGALAGPAASRDRASAPAATPAPGRGYRWQEHRQRAALAVLAVALLSAAAYVGGRGLAQTRVQAAPPPVAESVPVAAEPVPAAPEPAPPPPVAQAAPAKRVRAAVPATVAPPSEAPVAVAAAPAAAVPPPANLPAPAPAFADAPAPVPVPDRWQPVSEALARCAEEGGLSGFICDQRVRLASCDGYWGRVPHCPAPEFPANPR